MKKALKYLLQQLHILEAVRYGILGRWYTVLFKKEIVAQQKKELRFYQSFLSPCTLIFDIGANDGHKTIVFAQLADKVVACDPDPTNQKILGYRFKNNKNVFTRPDAVSDKNGTTLFYIDKLGSPLNTINPQWKNILEKNNHNRWPEAVHFSGDSITVTTVTLDALIKEYGKPDFIKIDVEGNEKNVLMGLTQPVNAVSFEVLLPEFLDDAVTCIDHLVQLNPAYLFNYAVEETLQLKAFITATEIKTLLQQLDIPHLEIIGRISNI
ncbi:MAG: FkbM family methyltransferase [Bacteroidetes bacterium]|nr:FkbM family methyltransferase [Bacteroidota bacterium]